MNTIAPKQSIGKEIRYYLINTTLLVNLLFFIDEGYYDLRWMKSIGNWIVFFIYTAVLLGLQVMISQLVLKHFFSYRSRIVTVIIGTIITIFVLVFTLFTKT